MACHVCPCCRIQRNIIALRKRATRSGQRRLPATAAEPVGQPPAGFVAEHPAEHLDAVVVARVGQQVEHAPGRPGLGVRSEEHTSELQSLMRISYAVFCLKKKKTKSTQQ